MLLHLIRQTAGAALLLCATLCAVAEDNTANTLRARFTHTVHPFLKSYCLDCHGGAKPKGDFDLSGYSSVEAVAKDFKVWETVLEKLDAAEMPPAKAKLQPKPDERRAVTEWIRNFRKFEAHRSAGDPGPVFARRLSNAEYDYTIRDLTGMDIRPTREFPVDPANQAGFDNSSESLTMSPALVKKYLEAARFVADHLVLKQEGFDFAPHPVATDTDRDKYCTNRIMDFYRKQRTDYADYFLGAWRFKHREALGKPKDSLEEIAKRGAISAKYLKTMWTVLNQKGEELGPLAALQERWRALPAAEGEELRAECRGMGDFVARLRGKLVPQVKNLSVREINPSAQCLVLWKDREMAANRVRYSGGALNLSFPGLAPRDDPADAAAFEETFHRFCSIFPDAFVVSERARVFLDPEREKKDKNVGRLLSAGFHTQMGFFRDDKPLYDLMLDEAQRAELDRLWQELDFIANVPLRQYSGFLWFERTDSSFLRGEEYDFSRAEDKDCGAQAKIDKLEKMYIAKARDKNASAVALQAMADYFKEMSTRIRWVEQARLDAEPSHFIALAEFAERAYRRPLTKKEGESLSAFYQTLHSTDKLSHEEAMREVIASILMSPQFLYWSAGFQPAVGGRDGRAPIGDYALASRLSYFLWSSMPDKELLELAAAKKLHDPDVLVEQARRMLKDPRARALAIEFCGNWLDFRRFEEHNSVDRGRFPNFTNELRAAMFEEPVRFFMDVARRNASVFDFLYADHTFVNPILARHYGMSPPDVGANEWARINAQRYGRGGLLPMAVFLTRNSPGLRTSPVKRGYWVVKRVLGEHIPPPPPKVPELPSDESKLGAMTLRELLAHHREDKSCASCHARFDAMGLVFEGFGPVGESRKLDLGGRPVETRAAFPNGSEGEGLAGLRAYLRQHRQGDFVETLCREMLAYGLGRTLLLSDDETINEMREKLAATGYRFEGLIEMIVTSPQFLNRRAAQ